MKRAKNFDLPNRGFETRILEQFAEICANYRFVLVIFMLYCWKYECYVFIFIYKMLNSKDFGLKSFYEILLKIPPLLPCAHCTFSFYLTFFTFLLGNFVRRIAIPVKNVYGTRHKRVWARKLAVEIGSREFGHCQSEFRNWGWPKWTGSLWRNLPGRLAPDT